jgi:chromosome segregation ATPase
VYCLSSQLTETKESLQQITAVAQEKSEEIVDLQGQLEKADEAFSKLEARQEQSTNAVRKHLAKAEKQVQEAENELVALEDQRQREQRAAVEEISRMRGEHLAELRELQDQLEEARSTAVTQAERASLEQKQLSMQIADLSDDLQRVRQTSLEQSKTIASMKEELDKKQATRAAIAANNAPPDFSSLHAKLAAVSGRSASGRSGLGNSLGSSTSSRKSDDGQVENLKTALESLKTEHGRAKDTVAEQKVEIRHLEDQLTRAEAEVQAKANELTRAEAEVQARANEIVSLEADVRKFRRDIDKMDGLLTSFRNTLCDKCTENIPLGKPKDPASSASQPQLMASPPPRAVVDRPPPPRSPFGALTGYQQKPHHIKSASISHGSYLKTCSRPGTPTKNEKHGYTGLHGTPEPLPIPSNWSPSAHGQSMRRTSVARDLEVLTAAGRATSSK